VSVGKSWLVSVQQAIKLFAYQSGIKLISARKDIDIRALKTNIDMLAKMQINATAQGIEITGTEEVLINGGGSYTRWSAAGVERGTSGVHTLHAASHSMAGPKSLPVAMPVLSVHALPKGQMLIERRYADDEGAANAPYVVTLADGSTRKGSLDSAGRATLMNVPLGSHRVEIGEDQREWTPSSPPAAPNNPAYGSAPDADMAQALYQAVFVKKEEPSA